MRTTVVLEHPEHLKLLTEEEKKCSRFICMTPYAYYWAQAESLDCRFPSAYYDHDKFYSLYDSRTMRLLDIIIALDNLLWEFDDRFKQKNIKPFFLNLYQFKLILDVIQTYLYWFNKIITEDEPEKIIVFAADKFAQNSDEGLSYQSNDPVCACVLELLTESSPFALDKRSVSLPNNLKEKKKSKIRDSQFFQRWKYSRNKQFEVLGPERTKLNILNLHCRDLAAAKSGLSEQGIDVHTFALDEFLNKRSGAYRFSDDIIDKMESDDSINSLFNFDGINIWPLVKDKFSVFAGGIETFYQRQLWLAQYIQNKKIDIVVSNSLSPYMAENVLALDICRKKNIPNVCWMHGGFGANHSFEGYDLTDFLIGEYYFSYGDQVSRTIDVFRFPQSVQSKIDSHYGFKKLNVITSGSPWMDGELKSKAQNKAKEIVTFLLGEIWLHNGYYMGGNNPYTYFQKFEENKRIIDVLAEYSEKYDIIIKSYPHDHRGVTMWQDYLKNRGVANIQIVSFQEGIESVLQRSDLTISTWVSTTFFQALYFDNDQFLFDNSDLTEQSRAIIENNCYFSDQIEDFSALLSKYLEEGKFYRKDKTELQNQFCDLGHRDTRVKKISNIFFEIVNPEYAHYDPVF